MRRTIFLLLLAIVTLPLFGQGATTTTAPQQPPVVTVTNADSDETREQLRQVLERLPPQVGKTLKLDPTLWNNQTYMATYPALAAFVAQHPEIAHSPSYYLESIWIPSDPVPETQSYRIWNSMMEAISIFGVILIFGGIFTWLIKTIIDHRRWNRLSKIQAEVHNKLLDRFAANEDLLKYVNTPAGRHFLESAPIMIDAEPRSISAPIGRVLWSVQVGIVLAAAGVGMKIMSWNVDKDVTQPLAALGILGMAIGGGFIVAAVVSYALSRKLGLWQPREPEAAAAE